MLFLLAVCIVLLGCGKGKEVSQYDVAGTWQIISGSSGNDLGFTYDSSTDEYADCMGLLIFTKDGKWYENERPCGGELSESVSYSTKGNVLRLDEADYKIQEYSTDKMTFRYDSEYSEYQCEASPLMVAVQTTTAITQKATLKAE